MKQISKRKFSSEKSNPKEGRLDKNEENISVGNIINAGLPHIGEQIFASLDSDELIQCLKVSKTWKDLAEKFLLTRWKGKMLEACEKGHTEIVQLLLETCNNEESRLNMTPLMIACKYGHKETVKLLLDVSSKQIINLNATDVKDRTALMFACIHGHLSVVRVFLEHSDGRIDLNATRHHTGRTYFRITIFLV